MIKDLPKKLKALRNKYGYSQKQVARKLDVSPSIVSGYETGERTPSIDNIISISYLYNCSVDYLLGKQSDAHGVFLDTKGLTDDQIRALSQLIDTMRQSNQ